MFPRLEVTRPDMKMNWPELVGKDVEEARATILREFPDVTIQLLGKNSVATMDFRIDRVRIVHDRSNKVICAARG